MFLESRSFGSTVMMFLLALFLLFFLYFLAVYAQREKGVSHAVYDYRTILELFLLDEEQIASSVAKGCETIDSLLASLLDISKEDRTYENTILLFDRMTQLSDLVLLLHILEAFTLLHPNESIRKTAIESKAVIVKYFAEKFANNTLLYNALKECRDEIEKIHGLNDQRNYCIDQILIEFERAGVHLSDEKKEQFSKLTEKIELTGSLFTQNITTDNEQVLVSLENLEGVPDYIIQSLQRTPN